MSDKNKWIEDVLNSTEGSRRAGAPDYIYDILEHKVQLPLGKGRIVSLNKVSAIAAGILLLLSVNVYFMMQHAKSGMPSQRNDAIQQYVEYYDLTNDNEMRGI